MIFCLRQWDTFFCIAPGRNSFLSFFDKSMKSKLKSWFFKLVFGLVCCFIGGVFLLQHNEGLIVMSLR